MRGKRWGGYHRYRMRRIIPAHAGQTALTDMIDYSHSDHPRACGANCHVCYCLSLGTGSSPRMRGKLNGVNQAANYQRIIPAHAGQTCSVLACIAVFADHPRACGANVDCAALAVSAAGSSPRMRGKRPLTEFNNSQIRIIPAHAGQTGGRANPHRFSTDHPRACGANYRHHFATGVQPGSSPRMRGKLG